MLDKHCIDIVLLTEHKLLPRSQHFLTSINSEFYSYKTCDSKFDNFGVVRCGKAGTAFPIRKFLNTIVSQNNNINNDRIIGIKIRKNNHVFFLCFVSICRLIAI